MTRLLISAIVDAHFRLIVDGKTGLPRAAPGRRAGTELNVAESSTISLKRPAVVRVSGLVLSRLDLKNSGPCQAAGGAPLGRVAHGLRGLELDFVAGVHDPVEDGLREGLLAGALDARQSPQHLIGGVALGRLDMDHLGPALGQCARLVHHQRVDLFHALQRLGIADQHAVLRAAANAHHDGSGVARPSAQGQEMISTATAVMSA